MPKVETIVSIHEDTDITIMITIDVPDNRTDFLTTRTL